MKLQPIVYTENTDEAVGWYERVLGTAPGYRSDIWTAFAVAGGTLGIHRVEEVPGPGRVVLSLVADEPLEHIIARLAEAGIEPERGIADEAFGRSFVLRDPDGSLVQVNEHHH